MSSIGWGYSDLVPKQELQILGPPLGDRMWGRGPSLAAWEGTPTWHPPPLTPSHSITSLTSFPASLALGYSSPDTWPVCRSSGPGASSSPSGVHFLREPPLLTQSFSSLWVLPWQPCWNATQHPCEYPHPILRPCSFSIALITSCHALLLASYTHCLHLPPLLHASSLKLHKSRGCVPCSLIYSIQAKNLCIYLSNTALILYLTLF